MSTTETKTKHPNIARQQFDHFKEKYPDASLIFRIGSYYECFYDDALVCSVALDCDIRIRHMADGPVDLVSLPSRDIQNATRTLISAGYKVAVCESIDNRDVIKTITPGTNQNLTNNRKEYIREPTNQTKSPPAINLAVERAAHRVSRILVKYYDLDYIDAFSEVLLENR